MKNCTHVLKAVLCLCLSLMSVKLFAQATAPFTHQGLTASTGDFLGFLQYKPADYDQHPGTKYPIIIFLHGIGERGNGTTDLDKVAYVGMPRIIYKGNPMRFTWNGKTETFLVLAPQCPMKYGMWPSVFVNDLITYAKQNLRIDTNRIYLTGLSMGGGGSLRYISDAPADNAKRISAVATCSAPCTFGNGAAAAAAHLPVWCFHAEDDPTASVQCTKNAIAGLNQAKVSPKPLLDLWPTGGHIVWDRVYTDTNYVYQGVVNIYEWFLGQNKTLPVNILPVTKASDATTTTGSATATLDASASSDADGKLVRFVWKKISGPNAGMITTPMGAKPTTTVTGLTIAGTYKYAAFAVDDRAAFTSDTITVTVNAGQVKSNVPPVAKAGNDIAITLPVKQVTLNGSSSSDADGSISTYAWTKISGPSQFTITAAGSSTTTVTNLAQGTYLFKLTVTDDKGATDTDTISVKVNAAANIAPVANAGNDVTINLPVNQVTLDGSSSSDADGSISTYAWTKISGPVPFDIATAGSSKTTVTGLVEGTYLFKIVVTDNNGAIDADTVSVKVNPAANIAPVAKAGADISITLPTNTATLDGAASSDIDGSISNYSWSKISGPASFAITSASSASTAVTGLVQGTYQFRLVVKDNKGASSADTITVKVNQAPNVLPIAKAGNDIVITLPLNKVTLNGNGSSDADGTINSYSWIKISGPAQFSISTPNVPSTLVVNLVQGTYQFRLLVTDNRGGSSADTIMVTVNAAPPPPNSAPVADAGADQIVTLPMTTTSLNGTESFDADGTIKKYAWTKVTGPAGGDLTNPSLPVTSATDLVEGRYTFRLAVTDNDGAVDADTVVVIVNAAILPPPDTNKAPIAKAGNNITITLPLDSTTLNGSASSDPDGSITGYFWSKISGPGQFSITSPGSSVTDLKNVVEGTYSFRLQVKDNSGEIARDTIIVTVLASLNTAPIADAGQDFAVNLPDPVIRLNGLASTDPDGSIVTYSWTQVSGPGGITITNSSTSTPGITGVVAGDYLFRLTVTDNTGATGFDDVKVTVIPDEDPAPPIAYNFAPIAVAGADQTVGIPETTATLDASASHDRDGNIASYAWQQVSGPSSATIEHADSAVSAISGLSEGEYSFVVTVTDSIGAYSTDTMTISVVNNLRYEQTMSVYPNPARSNLMLQMNSDTTGRARISIYNVNGVLVKSFFAQKNPGQFRNNIDVSKLQAGLYYVQVIIGQKQKMITKFIKR